MKKNTLFVVMLFILFTAWANNTDKYFCQFNYYKPNYFIQCIRDTAKPMTFYFNWTDEKQTIHSFGASDCWTVKFIGKWKNTEKKDKIADYLFSLDTLQDGSPKGIGLSLWRFNIGAGSYEQDTASHIADIWRREECFLKSDGSYDWNKQQGQQWFLNAAKKRGVKYILGFSIAPPVSLSRNGYAYNSDSGKTAMNIQANKMPAYSEFLAKVSRHFNFNYLSPVNETQWSWGNQNGGSQEGTQASNDEITMLVRLLSTRMKNEATKIVVPESGQWDFLYGRNNDNRGDQIYQLFSPSSKNYIGNLHNVVHAISSHSYGTTCPDDTMINIRTKVVKRILEINPSLQTWQTEFGVLRNICNQYHGYPRSTNIDYGIYVAKVIHHDLTVANVCSWQWWLSVSPNDYSDALVYINDQNDKIDAKNCRDDGIVYDSKQLWAMGNFSRFVRPNMKRIGVIISNINDEASAAAELMVSAFKNSVTNQLVVVIINPENKIKRICLKDLRSKFCFKNSMVDMYITDATNSLQKIQVLPDNIEINAKSITTIIGNMF